MDVNNQNLILVRYIINHLLCMKSNLKHLLGGFKSHFINSHTIISLHNRLLNNLNQNTLRFKVLQSIHQRRFCKHQHVEKRHHDQSKQATIHADSHGRPQRAFFPSEKRITVFGRRVIPRTLVWYLRKSPPFVLHHHRRNTARAIMICRTRHTR